MCVITAWCVRSEEEFVSKATHASGDNRRDKGRPPQRKPGVPLGSVMRLVLSPLMPTVKGSDMVGNRRRQTTTVVSGSSKKSAVKPLKLPPRRSQRALPQEAFTVTPSWHGLQRFARRTLLSAVGRVTLTDRPICRHFSSEARSVPLKTKDVASTNGARRADLAAKAFC